MKICYVVTCLKMNTGLGGHYHSLKATVESIKDKVQTLIVIIGDNPCPTIENSGLNFQRISIRYNVLSGIIQLIQLVRESNISVLHSFDKKADFFVRSVCMYLKLPKINTKCGGASPNRYYPFQKNVILYSSEDYRYFSTNQKFLNSNIHLIPNRVIPIVDDELRIDKLRRFTTHKIVFLRISRIGDYYKSSLLQSINLIKLLQDRKLDVELIIVGKIESQSVLEELKLYSSGNSVVFVTNPEFTSNASQLIGLADCVIGTGRGLMEAASKNKILLCPLKDSNYPVLLNSKNFEELFYYNFSERSKLSSYNEAESLDMIQDILSDVRKKETQKAFISDIYHRFFSIQSKVGNYLNIYRSLHYEKEHKYDYFLHLVVLVKFYLKRGHVKD